MKFATAMLTLVFFLVLLYPVLSLQSSLTKSREVDSPSDFLNENDIIVLDSNVVLNVKDAFLTKFADTNSMDPVLDENSNGIEVPYTKDMKLNVGDIISFEYDNFIRIHRIISIENDEQGVYYLTKGDNAKNLDALKVRPSQIKGKLIGV